MLVTNDEPLQATAHQWLGKGKTIPALIEWPQEKYKRMTIGEIVQKFEELAEKDQPSTPITPSSTSNHVGQEIHAAFR